MKKSRVNVLGVRIHIQKGIAYGLIEYIGNSDTFMVDYKNRKGERKRASVTFEQIYSVMEYLIRAGQFTEKARMEKYEKDFAEKSCVRKSDRTD